MQQIKINNSMKPSGISPGGLFLKKIEAIQN